MKGRSMTTAAIASLPRGCGTRVRGAAYWECGLDPDGATIEEFLIDCPSLIPSGLSVAPRGVTTIEVGGVTHVVDWVGSEHYLNVSDFVSEVSRLGLSRRLPSTLDFSKITPASRILLIHARARVENASLYGPFRCPKGFHDHGPGCPDPAVSPPHAPVLDGAGDPRERPPAQRAAELRPARPGPDRRRQGPWSAPTHHSRGEEDRRLHRRGPP